MWIFFPNHDLFFHFPLVVIRSIFSSYCRSFVSMLFFINIGKRWSVIVAFKKQNKLLFLWINTTFVFYSIHLSFQIQDTGLGDVFCSGCNNCRLKRKLIRRERVESTVLIIFLNEAAVLLFSKWLEDFNEETFQVHMLEMLIPVGFSVCVTGCYSVL